MQEDFVEIYYEAFLDNTETKFIELIPISMEFTDYSIDGKPESIVVSGKGFINIE